MIDKFQLWEERYGEEECIVDFSGRPIYKYDYGNSKIERVVKFENRTIQCKTGWDIHHILPITKGGSNKKENLEIVNILTNREAANDTTFISNEWKYQVKKVGTISHHGKFTRVYGIFEYNSELNEFDSLCSNNVSY